MSPIANENDPFRAERQPAVPMMPVTNKVFINVFISRSPQSTHLLQCEHRSVGAVLRSEGRVTRLKKCRPLILLLCREAGDLLFPSAINHFV